ncbi:hypothetical protein F7725_021048 [Dissostichus mawsoni]|uniref:Uncharacterized protein n=1 Tax=Dissostichus mawsoni TaxID=36200 RepID=A0A7J5YF22_DISMA|nr:hypothetical protein F7725_021048 [Dissostichus mawsoni]
MNLNDFVVLPNNKAKSVKLNARNLQVLQMETVSLAHESKEMEEKLQQLKESMSKEKEERGQSGGFRWKSGQSGSLNSNSTKKNKENRLQKPPSLPSTIGLRTTRKSRLRGTHCGQCEVKTAGITDLQTHVSAREVVRRFQNKITSGPAPSTSANPNANPSPNSKSAPNQTYSSNSFTRQGDQIPEKGTDAGAQYMQFPPEHSQILAVDQEEEKRVEMIEDREDEEGFPISLLTGEYNEEESTRSFQEALRQWRGDEAAKTTTEEAMWIPIRPVSVSAMATQADLAPVRGAEGGGRGEGSVPVRVEFTENSLTYIDRLLLKKHRRTPIKTYRPSSASGNDSKSQPNINTVEETASLTAQEEDFHRYCASLFADPVSSGRPEPQITQPESCLVIQVLDEREEEDIHGRSIAQQRPDNNRKVPSVQQPLSKGTLLTQTAIINNGSSLVSCSSPSPALPSRQFTAPAPAKGAKRLHLSRNQTSQPEHLTKSSSSKSKPSACPTAQTSKTSIKTQPSKKPNWPPKVHESKPDLGSIQHLSSPSPAHSQTQILKPSLSPVLFPPDVSPVTVNRPPILEHHLSPSPSTFEVSPSSSTESILLPKVHQSTPIQKGSDVSLLPEQSQSSQLFPETISSPKLSQSFRSNQVSSRQSQHSRCDPESLLSDNQLQLPSGSSSSTPPPNYLALSPAVKCLSNKSPVDAFSSHGQTPTTEDSSVFEYSTPISVDHESTLDRLPSHFMDGIQNYPLNVKLEEEEISIDSGDEMSSDSLGLDPHEEESSDEEVQMHRRLTRGRTREGKEGNHATSHSEDPFVPEDPHRGKDLQTDEQEQLSEASVVNHNHSAGPGSERLCDPDGFPPQGLDMNSGHSDTQEHTHWSTGHGPSRPYTEVDLVSRMMKNKLVQPTGIQNHSTRPTRRGEISANELGTSALSLHSSPPVTLSLPACLVLHRAQE